MSKSLQFVRGNTSCINGLTGLVGELYVDTTKNVVVVQDGSTAGGFPMQKELVSGTDIKTVNSASLLGSGNLTLQPTLVSGTNIKTVNGNSLLGSGNISISGGGGGSTGDITFNASDISSDATVNLIVGSVGTQTVSGDFSVGNPMYSAILSVNEASNWASAGLFVTGTQVTLTDSSFGNGTVVIQLTSDLIYDSITYVAWVADFTLISGSIAGAGFPATSADLSIDNSHTWSFGSDGNLTVPTGSTINTVTIGTLYHSSNIITPLPSACCYNNTTTYTANPLIVNGALCVVGAVNATSLSDDRGNFKAGSGLCNLYPDSTYCGGQVAQGNVSIGKLALGGNIAFGCPYMGMDQIAIGTQTLEHTSGGCNNVAIGNLAMNCWLTANDNIAIGAKALEQPAPGAYTTWGNIAMGCCSLNYSCGSSNIALGEGAGAYLKSNSNIALGQYALGNGCDTGGANIGIGSSALQATKNYNAGIGLGFQAGSGIRCGNYSIVIGTCAMTSACISQRDIIIGYAAGNNSTFGPSSCTYGNIAIGQYVGAGGLCGEHNISMGKDALACNCNGSKNIVIGYSAGALFCGSSNYCNMIDANGDYNILIGACAGLGLNEGCNNIFIGKCVVPVGGGTSQYAKCNTIVIGNTSITCQQAPSATWAALSDQRDKSDIEDMPVGLDFLMEIRPVKFTWNTRDGNRVGLPDSGFIAQELLATIKKYNVESFLKLANDDHPDQLIADPGRLMPVIVKAIQELAAENTAIKARLATLEAR